MMNNLLRTVTGLTLAVASATASYAQDTVRFGTDWLAQGGHGGFYQALADGTY